MEREDKEFLEENLEIDKNSLKSKIEYLEELDKIENGNENNESKLNLIDILARDLLSRKFKIKKTMEYSDMIQIFLEKGKPQISTFCHGMVSALYSGESLNSDKLAVITNSLREIIKSEKDTKKILPSLKDVFVFWKNKKAPEKEASEYLSDRAKRSIELEIQRTKEKERKLARENVTREMIAPIVLDKNAEKETKEHKFIESIDDLERIKRKIQRRKYEIYKKLAKNSVNLNEYS